MSKEIHDLVKKCSRLFKIYFCFLCFFLPLSLVAQEVLNDSGIHWTKELSWRDITLKASNENKYIFIDAHATWCAPCKQMDKTVYENHSVGVFMNENFVCVKVQMDSSSTDDDLTHVWYEEANKMKTKYKIEVLPTYLFFSPNGDLVHKYTGATDVKEFLQLALDARDSARQYFNLIANYKSGIKNYFVIPHLVEIAKNIGDTGQARVLCNDYIKNYLLTLDSGDFFVKKNIEFVVYNSKSSDDGVFSLIYRNRSLVDSIMETRNYSLMYLDYIITTEEVDRKLWRRYPDQPVTRHPHWRRMFSTIERKYDKEFAQRIILNSQLGWYAYFKDWDAYCDYLIRKVEKYGAFGVLPALDFKLNNNAWDLFEHASKRDHLKKALQWSDSSIKIAPVPNPHYYDTYAHLLYKLGRVFEAIKWEQDAIALDATLAIEENRKADEWYKTAFDKMVRREKIEY